MQMFSEVSKYRSTLLLFNGIVTKCITKLIVPLSVKDMEVKDINGNLIL